MLGLVCLLAKYAFHQEGWFPGAGPFPVSGPDVILVRCAGELYVKAGGGNGPSGAGREGR